MIEGGRGRESSFGGRNGGSFVELADDRQAGERGFPSEAPSYPDGLARSGVQRCRTRAQGSGLVCAGEERRPPRPQQAGLECDRWSLPGLQRVAWRYPLAPCPAQFLAPLGEQRDPIERRAPARHELDQDHPGLAVLATVGRSPRIDRRAGRVPQDRMGVVVAERHVVPVDQSEILRENG